MKSRLLSIILIILVTFSFASCGDKEETVEPSGNYGDMEESELPESFRTDLVPIFKGGVIIDVQEDAGMPEFLLSSLTCYSDKPYAAVEEFYK